MHFKTLKKFLEWILSIFPARLHVGKSTSAGIKRRITSLHLKQTHQQLVFHFNAAKICVTESGSKFEKMVTSPGLCMQWKALMTGFSLIMMSRVCVCMCEGMYCRWFPSFNSGKVSSETISQPIWPTRLHQHYCSCLVQPTVSSKLFITKAEFWWLNPQSRPQANSGLQIKKIKIWKEFGGKKKHKLENFKQSLVSGLLLCE